MSFSGAAGTTVRVEVGINYEGYPRSELTGLTGVKSAVATRPPASTISKVHEH